MAQRGKNLPWVRSGGDQGSIPESGRSTGERNGNPLPQSRLENPMDRGAWWATVHAVTKNEQLTLLFSIQIENFIFS